MHVPNPRPRRAVRSTALALALSVLAGPAAIAGDEPDAAPTTGFDVVEPVRVSRLPWFQVPRRSRVVLRKMAAKDNVTLSKCVAYESDGQIRYEFHAWRRTGPFSREDVVLTEFTETVEQAQDREEADSLRARLSRLSDSISPR